MSLVTKALNTDTKDRHAFKMVFACHYVKVISHDVTAANICAPEQRNGDHDCVPVKCSGNLILIFSFVLFEIHNSWSRV